MATRESSGVTFNQPQTQRGFSISNRTRRNIWGFVFALPATILFVVFAAYPIAQTFYLSFFRYNLVDTPSFVGLGHYRLIATQPQLRDSIFFTFEYALGTYVPTLIIALLLALALNTRIPGQGVLRMINFIPVVASWVIVSVVWKLIFHQNGLFNVFLGTFGIDNISWLLEEEFAPFAIILPSVWKEIGFYMVIFLAGLQNIPDEYYEAARIDGANALAAFQHITLPLLRPTIVLSIVIAIINGLKIFIPPFVMTQGGPAGSTQVMALTIYQNAFAFRRMGRASAMAVVLFLIIFTLTVLQSRLYGTKRY